MNQNDKMNRQITLEYNEILPIEEKAYEKLMLKEKWKIYKNLIAENTNLKTQLGMFGINMNALFNENIELKKENKKLFDQLHDQNELNKQINSLIEENEKLKNMLSKLEQHICDQDLTIEKLNNKVDELKKDNTELKINNVDLNDRLKKIEEKSIFDKYLIAIQDVNRYDLLETKIKNVNTVKSLKKLREKRIKECHYINEKEDDIIMKNDKKTVLYNEMNNMPIGVKKMFEKKFPGVVNDVMTYIKINITTPSKDNLEEIEEYWE
jgi:uncharacterized coiled-coil protein SlyX